MITRPKYRRPTALRDYVMPFFIIICVGIIFVLLFNLWKTIFAEDVDQPVYMHIVDGSVQVKLWGTEDMLNLTSDTLIRQGDSVVTSANSKVIVEFFDGTVMRLSGGTDVTFQEFFEEDSDVSLSLLLVDGSLWFNKFYKDTGATQITVDMGAMKVSSSEKSIFEVESEFDKGVRVIRGAEVSVDVLNEAKDSVIATENIGVGQQIIFTPEVLQKFREFKSPTVLDAISDEFKALDWYIWNNEEDKAPTQFVKDSTGQFAIVEPEVTEDEIDETTEGTEDEDAQNEEEDPSTGEETAGDQPVASAGGTLAAPTITSVASLKEANESGVYVVTGNPATLTGTVSNAAKVIVNGYTLKQFKAGDTTWTYYANADYGYMKEGENTYEIYSVSDTGVESAKLYVKVLYQPVKVVPVTPAAEANTETAPAEGEAETPAEENTESPAE